MSGEKAGYPTSSTGPSDAPPVYTSYAPPPGPPPSQPQMMQVYAAPPGVPMQPMQPTVIMVAPTANQPMKAVHPGAVVPVMYDPATGTQMPVMEQPPMVQFMSIPANVPRDCPAGLEYLSTLDKLMIKQKKETLEIVTDIETENKYKIYNATGQQVYTAKEDSNFCIRQCCGSLRPFSMHITDQARREILTLTRPFSCDSPWLPFCIPCNACWLQSMEVRSPLSGNNLLGTIDQCYTLFTPKFAIKDEHGVVQLYIEGPPAYICCPCECCSSIEFVVKNLAGERIGVVTKKWSGVVNELLTDADNFGVSFPADLSVKMKAVLLAAVL
ncbi:Phospholipid scramblase 3 [Quaeritorhiza haematococci]|nr:Phospholipid scramblase 3 [Quaeritorhiza haematococci]